MNRRIEGWRAIQRISMLSGLKVQGYPRLSDISMLSAMRGTRGGDNEDMEGKSLHLTRMSRLSVRDSRTGIRRKWGINQDRGEPIDGRFQGSGNLLVEGQ